MAKQVITVSTCDHCGTDKGEIKTKTLKVDNDERELDLCPKGLKEFTSAVSVWAAMGTPVRNTRKTSTRGGARHSAKPDLSKVREWANANGHQVSDRGRVPADVQAAYDAAH